MLTATGGGGCLGKRGNLGRQNKEKRRSLRRKKELKNDTLDTEKRFTFFIVYFLPFYSIIKVDYYYVFDA